MADPAPAPSAPPPSPAPSRQSPAPGSLTGVSYDQPISDQAFDRLGPQEQSRFARVRNQANNPEWVPRSHLAPDPGAALKPGEPAPAPGEPASPAPAPAASVTEDGKLRIGEGETAFELSADDVKMLMAQKAEGDLRKTQIPANPEGYELKLPEAFKVPEGIEFKFDDASPELRDLKAWVHGKGIDQKTFSELLSFYAQAQIREAQAFRAAQAREVEKLGAHGTARVTAVEQWIRGMVGDDLGSALRGMMVSEKIVRALETIASKFTTQGAAPFSQAHRHVETSPGRVSDEEYSRMSQADRWAYARSHDQKQFYPGGNGGER